MTDPDPLDKLRPGMRAVVRRRIHHGVTDALGEVVAMDAETVLIRTRRGVERIEASYWKSGPQPGWVRTWDGRGLPALIRVRLIFPASDPRRWPDIVVAPMRASATPGEGLLPRATPPR